MIIEEYQFSPEGNTLALITEIYRLPGGAIEVKETYPVTGLVTTRQPTQDEVNTFLSDEEQAPSEPSPDIIRARELLATSPQAITLPEVWELLRIYGRLLEITT